MDYLLDTNVCIALINGTSESARTRFRSVQSAGAMLYVSSIVSFELWYGVSKSARREFNAERLEAFFGGRISTLAFDDRDAQAAGSVRADLEVVGRPIGAYDVLIAGQAMRHKLTLVTANVSEFARVKGLIWQDWAKPRAR